MGTSIFTIEEWFALVSFGFDISEPAGVNTRHAYCICYNSNEFNSWSSGKICQAPKRINFLSEPFV